MQGDGSFKLSQKGEVESNFPFVITAAHELKSPLSLVRQLALSLNEGFVKDSDREEIVRQIILTSEKALRLTTDLSRASRIEDGLFELEPINPVQVCDEVAHELEPLYKARGREIRVASKHRPALAIANKDLLRRIMLNFGDNALHYSNDEPVELKVTNGRSKIIRLSVRDYGPCIPTKVWCRLKKQLGTGVQTMHCRPLSSGLGLYIAGQFAEVMHGNIGATRHRDGATFYVDVLASEQISLL